MANDTHYMIIFTVFFLVLALITPFINSTFDSDYNENEVDEIIGVDAEHVNVLTVGTLILNLFALPFWTFGLPLWINLWILLWARAIYIYLIVRAILGGG